jgi:phosphatidylglycerol lysyltransferase
VQSIERARELILQLGWNSTCYQLLNPGIEHWFSREYDAVIGYTEWARVRVVAGAPVCRHDEILAVVREFERDSAEAGRSVCYFASEARLERALADDARYHRLLLGAQPVWTPSVLAERFTAKASLRMQLSRSWNKGVVVEEWTAPDAEANPDLQRILREWLSTRGLPSLHFLVEPQTLQNLRDRRILVALRAREVIGFVNLSPVPLRNGWLVEQFVRGKRAPNGTIELLLHRAAEVLAESGAEYLTLGLSPLSHIGEWPSETSPLIRALFFWARAHGKRFYNFTGLEFFKTKFEPERWEPIYAIVSPRGSMLCSLYAIACAFTNGHPMRDIAIGALRAVKQELHWIKGRATAARQDK